MVVSPNRDAGAPEVIYPDSDGLPMADNTKQWSLIVLIKENLDLRVDDFVAGNLLWYPVEGNPKVRIGPDVLVALGRPKGHRGSYKQWEEGGIAPQVVFEVLSPSNSTPEMMRKAVFYFRHGVEEFYVVDPDGPGYGFVRDNGDFEQIDALDGWQSPRLGMRFAWDEEAGENVFYGADGERFLSTAELAAIAARADENAARADENAARADAAEARVAEAAQREALLVAKLRELGVEPPG